MRFFARIWRLFKVTLALILFSLIGILVYVKCAPKITINSANNIVLYDKDNYMFFKGSE